VDDDDPEVAVRTFISRVASAGCTTFIVHARKAFLKGLNPKQNRSVPPLNYDLVYAIKRENPHLQIIINGGITYAVCLDRIEYVMEADHCKRQCSIVNMLMVL